MKIRRHIPLGAETRKLREEILSRHATIGSGGRPSRCYVHPMRKPKVIFPTEQAALRAEQDLAHIGALRQIAYPCGDHYHLSKQGVRS